MPIQDQVVIFGLPNDPHVVKLKSAVSALGAVCTVYSPISDLDENSFPGSRIPSVGQPHALDNLECSGANTVIWLRNKFRVITVNSEEDQRRIFESANREDYISAFADLLNWRIINSVPVISFNKLRQLALANALNAKTPATLVSTSKDEISAFVDSLDSAIIKPFSLSMSPPIAGKISTLVSMGTSDITIEEVRLAPPESFESCPAIYQERIPKEYELRVAAFGEHALGYRINSQQFEQAKVDWRRGEALAGMVDEKPVALPDDLRKFIAAFLRASRLDTGMFDFAVQPNGRWVFFECNPSGQWAALDGEDGRAGPISRMFAEGLVSLCRGA